MATVQFLTYGKLDKEGLQELIDILEQQETMDRFQEGTFETERFVFSVVDGDEIFVVEIK